MRSHFLLPSLLLVAAMLGLASCTQATVESPPPTRTPDPLYVQAAPTKEVVWVDSDIGAQGEQPSSVSPGSDPQPADPEPTPVPAPETCVRVVVQYGVNVRSGPGTANPVVAQLAPNEEFPFLAENPNGDWFRIRHPDVSSGEAWVAGIYNNIEMSRKVDCSP
ncbi:MAG: SH3 domain-containing protein [Caldilineaceae bacterium SB0665_bin_21]|nr:SH3 domain-containing protein [Caldilineaceae bacterium SB0665_bin_21]MYA03480.1 SH3 domain-containing protein [Caldilineaceae bacterium SB0664_bin_22]